MNFPLLFSIGGGEDKLIKLKRGSYETLTSNNDSIPYGQPVIGDVSSGSLKSGQCGSVMTVGDSDNSAYNSVDYRYYALQSNPQASGIFICDPNYYNNGVPYGILVTDVVDTGVITVNNGDPSVASVLPVICGGTGSGTVEGARTVLGLGDLATLDTINLNSSSTTGTLPLSKGGTGATTASAARSSLGLGSLATLNSINLNSSNVTNTLPISKGGTGATTASAAKSNIGLSNVVNERQYSAAYPPPYPVTKVNNKTGAVTLSNTDVGAVKNGGVTGQDGSHQMAMSWNGNAIIVGVDNNAAVKTLMTTDDSRISDSGFWAPWQSTNWVSDGSAPFVCYIRKIGHIIYYEFDLTAKLTINCTDESAAKLVTYNITDNSYKPNMTIYKMVTIINGSPLYFKFDPSGSEIRCFGIDIPIGTRLRGTWTWMGQ